MNIEALAAMTALTKTTTLEQFSFIEDAVTADREIGIVAVGLLAELIDKSFEEGNALYEDNNDLRDALGDRMGLIEELVTYHHLLPIIKICYNTPEIAQETRWAISDDAGIKWQAIEYLEEYLLDAEMPGHPLHGSGIIDDLEERVTHLKMMAVVGQKISFKCFTRTGGKQVKATGRVAEIREDIAHIVNVWAVGDHDVYRSCWTKLDELVVCHD